MAVVTQISPVVERRAPAAPSPRLQLVPVVDGRATLTLVSAAPRSR